MTTSTTTTSLSDILRSVERSVREARDTMHFGDGLPVTFLEGWEIERCFDALSDVLAQMASAIPMAAPVDLTAELVSTLRHAVDALNTAPRFRVRWIEAEARWLDSYHIAARCDRVLAKARGFGL